MLKDMSGIMKFLRRRRTSLIFLFIFLGAASAGAYYFRPKPPVYEFAQVERRDIKQEVSVTGRVKPAQEVSLAFEKGGRVSRVFVKVGDSVKAGALLAILENGDVLAGIDEAKARLSAAEANLRQLKQGTRSEEIDVQKTKVVNAKIVFGNTEKSLSVAMDDAYTKADDAIRNKTDKFFINPRSANPQLSFSFLEGELETSRADIEKMFIAWNLEKASPATLSSGEVKTHLVQIKIFLDKAALALSIAVPSGSITQTTLDGYKTDVSSARVNINSALSALDGAEQVFRVAQSNVTLEESNLTLKEAPTEANTIFAQEALVAQAQANVRSFEAEAAKNILRAPMLGTVVTQDVKPGEIVSPNTPLVSIISKSKLEIEAFIPEADIAKIQIGDVASTTLDAYGETVLFGAKVVSIDPAETLIEGVATYKTTFLFQEDDARIKSGMTANIDILTEEKNRVLALPQRLLIRKDNGVFAQILENGAVKEIPVQTGLRGSNGYVEIVSGLMEGQEIVVPKN